MIDFEDIDFPHEKLNNNNEEDLNKAVDYICSLYADAWWRPQSTED